jgi:hypothetical protein
MTPARLAFGDLVGVTRRVFAREPGLTALGLAGLGIAALCLVAVAVRGPFIPPEGKMLDAATFSFGVGVFTLTLALLLPEAGFSPVARRRWRRLAYVFLVFGLVVEPLQAFRGLDPRFTEVGGAVDVVAGIVFGVTALLNTVLFVVLGLRFFRDDVLGDRPLLRAGIRYGVVAVWVSFAVGVVMSLVGGRLIGDAGDLMLTHALGVHGIQTVPLVALLIIWAGDSPHRALWLHAAGIGWLTACAATLINATLGDSPSHLSILMAVALAGLVTWLVATGNAATAVGRRLQGSG